MQQFFQVSKNYTKRDIYEILAVPEEKRKGAWNTGYRKWKKDIYIFANIGTPGRSGKDYNNFWDGDELVWYTKPNSNLLKDLLDPQGSVFLFTRTDNKLPFTFHGNVIAQAVSKGAPSKIIWRIVDGSASPFPDEQIELWEGALKIVKVNKYERNPDARLLCIEHYGTHCQVCGFNFDKYGDIGVGYIHIHHLTLVSSIGEDYIIDPIKDLRPVCANCHAIIHRRNPPYTIDELKNLIE